VRSQSSVQAEFHHERLGIRKLGFVASIEGLGNEQVLAKYPLNYLKMLVWVVSLVICLLLLKICWAEYPIDVHTKLPLVEWSNAIIEPFFFLFGTFLKENFPQNVLLFLVGVIVLYIVIVRLVEHAI
jgi:uncharacterized membrane protein